jgi:hypothetical protein
MSHLGYSIGAIAVLFTSVVGLGGRVANANPASIALEVPARLTQPLSSGASTPRVAQNNSWNDCRKITQDYTQFYTNFPGGGGNIGGVGILNSGDRVRLLNGGQTYSYNGQIYYQISSPYASQSPTYGYILTRTPLDNCGPRRPMW